MISFIGALLGSLTAYAAVFGLISFLTWRKNRRTNARIRQMLGDLVGQYEKRTPEINAKPPSERNN